MSAMRRTAAVLLAISLASLAAVAHADGRPRAGSSRRREAALERCMRHLVEARGLNEYGDARDLLYTGGTPLFNEATGTATPWLAYMKQRHPELVKACRSHR
jgi:hypothetical protein